VDKRWATVIVVLPWVILSKAICTNTTDSESNDEVTSSNNNNFGRRIIALAIAFFVLVRHWVYWHYFLW